MDYPGVGSGPGFDKESIVEEVREIRFCWPRRLKGLQPRNAGAVQKLGEVGRQEEANKYFVIDPPERREAL